MADLWNHRIAGSITSAEAAVRAMEWGEAQAWCNFVLFVPRVLPDGMTVEHAMIRPEAPLGRVEGADATGRSPWSAQNRAAHRCEVAGGGRRLRVKQFLYDWAPPSFDCPGLWKSETRAFPVGRHVGWLGHDYNSRPGGSLCIRRTTIELSVTEGAFTDEELHALCRGLAPVDDAIAARIDATPMWHLMYTKRYVHPMVLVPISYWAHQRKPRQRPVAIFAAAEVPAGLPGSKLALPASEGVTLDTVQVFGPLDAPQEVEWLSCEPADPGRTIRFIASPSEALHRLPYPPALDQQPCKSRTLDVNGATIHHAWRDDAYGAHEAVWQRHGENVMLLAKPMVGCDLAWFERLLAAVV